MTIISPSMSRRLCLALWCVSFIPGIASAADRGTLEQDAPTALQKLNSRVPTAKSPSQSDTAVLVFPKITKAGLGVGAQYGDGVMFKAGKVAGFYNSSAAS